MILDSRERIDHYTKIGAYKNVLVTNVLKDTARKYPDKLALVDANNKGEFARLSPDRYKYKELDDAIDRVATGLLEKGIAKDDIVVLQLPNITEHVIVSFALWRIGAIAAPVIMQFRSHELRYIIGLTQAKAVITLQSFHGFNHVELATKLKTELASLKHVISADEIHQMMSGEINRVALNNIRTDPNDLTQINWTSGTEANPKGCPKSHNHWMAMGTLCGETAQMTSEDVILCPFPLQYISSTAVFLMPVFMVGATYILHHPFDPVLFLQQINDEKATYGGGSPAMHLMLLRHPDIDKYSLKSLRLMMTGSAPTPEYVVKTYLEKYHVEMINFWGQNELTGLPAGPKDVSDPYLRALTFPHYGKEGVRWNTKGAEYIETRILREGDDTILNNVGDVGELVFRSPGVLPCYFKNPELDKKAFVDGFFRTGDLFKIEENNLLTFFGRKKDIIIRGGQNISPEEIENVLQYHPKVLEVAVVGYPDARLGEKACACVVLRKGESLTLDEIADFMRQKDMAIFKFPERLEIVENLSRNPAGKVQKSKLREDIKQKIKE